MKRFIIPLTLLCFFTLSGSTIETNQQQEFEIEIFLPSSGNFNEWTIVFKSTVSPYTEYEFNTDDDTFDSQILGSLPPGEYDITFDSGYSWAAFDLGVSGPNGLDWETGYPYATMYDQEIGQNSSIQIDCVNGCN